MGIEFIYLAKFQLLKDHLPSYHQSLLLKRKETIFINPVGKIILKHLIEKMWQICEADFNSNFSQCKKGAD